MDPALQKWINDDSPITDQMVRSVLAHAENRLRMNPVPLDKGVFNADELNQRLEGLTREMAADHDAWAQKRHDDQVAVIPPTKCQGETIGRFAFLHPGTSMDVVREVPARTA